MTGCFQENLERCFSGLPNADGLKNIRIKALERFRALGLPERSWEVWRALKLRNLFDKRFDLPSPSPFGGAELSSHILSGCEETCLVFVNGEYRKELSRTEGFGKGAVVASLEEAVGVYGSFFNHQWLRSIKEEADPFVLINAILGKNGAFVYLPPRCLVERSVQVIHLIDAPSSCMMLPRLHLVAGAQAQIELLVTPFIKSDGHFIQQCLEMNVEEGARIRLCQMNWGFTPSLWHFDSLRAQLKRDSSLKTVSLSNGSETVRSDCKVILAGENGEVSLNGMWMLQERREAHTNVLIDHQAPHCRSNQLFKGVLDDASRSSFEGKIYVRREAQKTNAFQLNNNLLLSKNASADSKPNLEIFADDVKASHGATVGQLEKEQLFYLKARGMSEEDAQRILIQGYFQEIFETVFHPHLKLQLEEAVR